MPTTKNPPWRQGNAPADDAANGKPELNVAIWMRCELNQSCGGAHTRFPRAVSVLIMDLADKNFPRFSTSRPQNHARPRAGALSSINITPNINMLLIKVNQVIN